MRGGATGATRPCYYRMEKKERKNERKICWKRLMYKISDTLFYSLAAFSWAVFFTFFYIFFVVLYFCTFIFIYSVFVGFSLLFYSINLCSFSPYIYFLFPLCSSISLASISTSRHLQFSNQFHQFSPLPIFQPKSSSIASASPFTASVSSYILFQPFILFYEPFLLFCHFQNYNPLSFIFFHNFLFLIPLGNERLAFLITNLSPFSWPISLFIDLLQNSLTFTFSYSSLTFSSRHQSHFLSHYQEFRKANQ